MADDLESFLEHYDGPQQETKRAIGRYLYEQPREDHTPVQIHEHIEVDVALGTVENNLSDLKDEVDCINQNKQLTYSWSGEGRPKSLRETVSELLSAIGETLTLDRLGGALFPTVLAMMIFSTGVFNGIFFTLLALLNRNELMDTTAQETLIAAGVATTVASAILLMVPVFIVVDRIFSRVLNMFK